MTALHAYFSLRQQQSFQRALDGSSRGQLLSHTGLSTSGGKSWSKPSALNSATALDVNVYDRLGRTVLHLACASAEPSSLEYVRLLLAHPGVNVNLLDAESHWTALHRALFHGNIGAAVLLLKRPDIDTSVKDLEGYTAFDLYNSTLTSTKPSCWGNHEDPVPAELFTWGINKNAALGHGDGDDRVYADHITIPSLSHTRSPVQDSPRLESVKVKQVAMSRLHTVIVTDETRGNLRVCGFGSGGRLGPTPHTQYNLTPFPPSTLPYTIASVALGQDHTLAVTKAGEVLSWGLNRFSQLGYIIDPPAASGLAGEELLIQTMPKKLYGVLKKEVVRGVAACKTASCCWTQSGEVFTWGTNSGQLGYDKIAQPVQVLPRKVTKIAHPVIHIAMSDTAMACLLTTQDVVCILNDRHFKINFPTHTFPSEMRVYRPPQAMRDANIAKITSCEDTFAALSSNGEVFTFTVPGPSDTSDSRTTIKPQRVWALRKQFSGVRDVALGADGSLIVATQSGHVFIRSRNPKSSQSSAAAAAKTFKFQRVPYLQRVVGVCANSMGAFGALRVDYQVRETQLEGEGVGMGMEGVQPYLRLGEIASDVPKGMEGAVAHLEMSVAMDVDDDEPEGSPIQKDITDLQRLLRLLSLDRQSRKGSSGQPLFHGVRLAHGGDIMVQTSSGSEFPTHRVWLAARCPVLRDILEGRKTIQDETSKISIHIARVANSKPAHSSLARLEFGGCSAMSVLILLTYFYSDELLSIWDNRVIITLERRLRDLKIKPAQVKLELHALARVLELPKLMEAVQAPGKRSPMVSMAADMQGLSTSAQHYDMGQIMVRGLAQSALRPDMVIQLRDKEFLCHSVVLRARSSFFAAFFDDDDWTARRWDEFGMIRVDLRHWDWRIMQFPLRFLSSGCEGVDNMLDSLGFEQNSDEVIEFMFDIIAAANELLLYRLVFICSTVILKHLNVTNACYILSDATHFQARALMDALQEYMAANMESMLEGRMLDDLSPSLIKQLSEFVRKQQAEKFAVTRSTKIHDRALQQYGHWLALQDIPQPVVPIARPSFLKDPKLSPPGPSRRNRRPSGINNSPTSPIMRTLAPIHSGQHDPSDDDVFAMDDPEHDTSIAFPDDAPSGSNTPTPALLGSEAAAPSNIVWTRRPSTQRVDMKTIMAEAASTKLVDHQNVSLLNRPTVSTSSERLPQRERRKMQWSTAAATPDRPDNVLMGLPRPNTSPWKQTPAHSPKAFPAFALPPAPLAFVAPQGTPPAVSSHRKAPEVRVLSTSPSTAKTPATPPGSLSQTRLIFSPSGQSHATAASPSTSRHVSSGGVAWTLPHVQAVVESPTLIPTSGMSFVAIQQLQLDQGFPQVLDKQSLLKIQEEEQARQAEADFLKWWTAEEERVKLEEAQIVALTQGGKQGGQGGRSKAPRKPKGIKKNLCESTANVEAGGAGGARSEGTRHNARRQASANKANKANKANTAKINVS